MRLVATATSEKAERAVERWRRAELAVRAHPLVDLWSERLAIARPDVGLKRMWTRWGSCSESNSKIWLNTELSRTAPKCLEYVIVHELAHFHVRAHDDAFTALLDEHLPDWRATRAMLTEIPYAR